MMRNYERLPEVAMFRPMPELNSSSSVLRGPVRAPRPRACARTSGWPTSAPATSCASAREKQTELGAQGPGATWTPADLVPDELVIAMILDKVEEERATTASCSTASRAPSARPTRWPRSSTARAPAHRRAAGRGRRRRRPQRACSGRRQCSNGHLYHVDFDPPKHDGVCDQDGKPLFRRKDDEPDTVKKRLATYHKQTEPLKAYYEERGFLRRFDGTPAQDRGPRPHPRHARDPAARGTAVIVKKSPGRDRSQWRPRRRDPGARRWISCGERKIRPGSPPGISTTRRRSSSARRARRPPSRATAASRARSAPRRTTWSSTAFPGEFKLSRGRHPCRSTSAS